MAPLENFKTWQKLNEVRKPRKCPIPDFKEIRESTLYKDLISLGWVEVDAKMNPRLEAETFQGERQGNLRFKHPNYPMSYRMNLNGGMWQDALSGRAYRIALEVDHDPKWYRKCLGLEDYKDRLEYLIKRLLWTDGFITDGELHNTEGGIEIIMRKLDENPENIKKLKTVPPSLKKDAGYLKKVEEFGLF